MLIHELLMGPLFKGEPALPLRLRARMCDLRPRFLAKGRVGRGYRAIARNGRVLLATDQPLAALADQPAQVRVQIWHRAILAGDPAEPYGILLSVRSNSLAAQGPSYRTQLVRAAGPCSALTVDLGGGLLLEFQRC